jgi:hypothetical protein
LAIHYTVGNDPLAQYFNGDPGYQTNDTDLITYLDAANLAFAQAGESRTMHYLLTETGFYRNVVDFYTQFTGSSASLGDQAYMWARSLRAFEGLAYVDGIAFGDNIDQDATYNTTQFGNAALMDTSGATPVPRPAYVVNQQFANINPASPPTLASGTFSATGPGLVDTFAATGLLSANNADTGQAWTQALGDPTSYSSNFTILSGNELYTNNSGGSDAAVAYNSDDASLTVHVLGTISGSPEIGLVLRVNGFANADGYMGRFVNGSGWQFYSATGGGPTYTQLGSNVAGTLADGDIIRFTASGSGATVTLTLYKNGTQVATATDSSGSRFTSVGAVGIHLYNPGSASTTNYQVHKITAL